VLALEIDLLPLVTVYAAVRTGVDGVNALVTMLIQSERFGTNVSESLKVHADALRTKRRMQAQEAASKVPAKLSIPMMLCIFPVLYIAILGPAMIGIYRTFFH
jgi:tight adherence protein C